MNKPVPTPRSGGEVKKPIPAPRTRVMPICSQKSDESTSSKSSEDNGKTLSRTARRVKSFSSASKQIAGDLGGLVHNKFESTRLSVRRLTRTFSISSHQENSESQNVNSSEKAKVDDNLDIFNSIKFNSPMIPPQLPVYINWEPPRKRAEEVLGDHLFNLAPPSYPPPSLPDDSLYNDPPAVPSPISTISKKVEPPKDISTRDIYESVYPFERDNQNDEFKDCASVTTEDTSLTVESSSQLSTSSSWKFYDSVFGNLKKELEEKVTLTPIKAEECLSQPQNIHKNSNDSVDVRNSMYENFVLPRPSQSVIFQFDPLLNPETPSAASDAKLEDYRMLEEILQEDLYGNISANHKTIDTWSISDSEAEEFANPPSPPVRFDSLQDEAMSSNVKEIFQPAAVPPDVNNSKNCGERKSWLKHVKDVVIASSEIIKGKHKDGLVPRPMVHMKNSAYKKGMLYKVQNGPVEDLFGEYSARWCILENGVFVCYSNNSCENVKEHFSIDTILSIESVKHHRLKLKSDNYVLHCFKINASGKTRGSHVYGSRNLSDRRIWMQTIAESLTTRFGTKVTTDYIRMGWTYIREGVTGKWMGAWIILHGRNLMYAVDGQLFKTCNAISICSEKGSG